MLVGFVAWEARHPEPRMRLGIFRTRTVTGANVAGFILGTALFSMFLMLTLHMQQVLGYSAMKTGVAYLAVAGTAIIWSAVAALVGLILMHSGRDAGFGGMGFTPASQGGTHIVERNLTRLTVVVAIIFVANCIALFHALK
jgi:protein translocase SecG subunit